MNFKIAIPSYRRAEILRKNTLNALKALSIPDEMITIFVVEDEIDTYRQINPGYNIVVGRKGLPQQREFIENYFSFGEHIIFMDDDIKSIVSYYDDIKTFFNEAFELCHKENAFIWGIYPVKNEYFMMDCKKITTDLKYIVGSMYGIINRPNDNDLKLTISSDNGNKEDVERTLLYYVKDRKVIRFNRVRALTKYYGSDGGGLGRFNERLEPMKNATIALNNKYPLLTRIKVRKNGMHEIEFRKSVAQGFA